MSGLAILERWPPGRARSFAHPTSAHSGGHDVGCTAGPPTKYAERAGADEMVELQSFTMHRRRAYRNACRSRRAAAPGAPCDSNERTGSVT
jgi:hypothetical protein